MKLFFLTLLTFTLISAKDITAIKSSIPDISGKYELISKVYVPTEAFKDKPSYQEQYIYLAGTLIIEKISDDKFGYYYATKIKKLAPNRFYGIFKFEDTLFKETRFDTFFNIDLRDTKRWILVHKNTNIIETSLWKKVNINKKVSPYLRKILSKTRNEIKKNNWIY